LSFATRICDFATSHVIARVHCPSEVYAGEIAGTRIVAALFADGKSEIASSARKRI